MSKKQRVAVGLDPKEIQHLDKRAMELYGDADNRRAEVIRRLVRDDIKKQAEDG